MRLLCTVVGDIQAHASRISSYVLSRLVAFECLGGCVAVEAPGCVWPVADALSAEEVAVFVDPGSLDAEVAGELAGGEQLGLPPRVPLVQELRNADGDLLDGLRGEVDCDPAGCRGESAPWAWAAVAWCSGWCCGGGSHLVLGWLGW
jgi:hypothetical protein